MLIPNAAELQIRQDGDIGFANWLIGWYEKKYKKQTKPVFQIFTPGNGSYIDYSRDSTASDF